MSDERAVLSVDLEWFRHTPAYRNASGTLDREAIGLEAIEFLLEALRENDAHATFFVVSEIAAERPGLIREIEAAGHEIASHTHTHRRLSCLEPGERRMELQTSREILASITDGAVAGVRAPAFDASPSVLRACHETGYEYDSSVIPSRRIPGWYGGEFAVSEPCTAAALQAGLPEDLLELPVGVMPLLRLPLSGAWLRLFGCTYALRGVRWLAARELAPVLYVHPWELVDLPPVEGVPRRVYWRTGRWSRGAVKRILAEPLNFVTARSEVERVR